MGGEIYLILIVILCMVAVFFIIDSNSEENESGSPENTSNEEITKTYFEEHEYFHGMHEVCKKPPKNMYIGEEHVGDHDPRMCYNHNGIIVRKVCFDYIPHKLTFGCKLPQGILKSQVGRNLQDYLDELHSNFPSLYLESEFSEDEMEDERTGYFALKNTRFGMEFCSAYFRRKCNVNEVNSIGINIDIDYSSNRIKAWYDIDMQLYRGNQDEIYILWNKYDLTLGQLKKHINQYLKATNDLYEGRTPRKSANY
jgi:hypothetical protein